VVRTVVERLVLVPQNSLRLLDPLAVAFQGQTVIEFAEALDLEVSFYVGVLGSALWSCVLNVV